MERRAVSPRTLLAPSLALALLSLTPALACAQEAEPATPPLPSRVTLTLPSCARAGIAAESFARMLRAELAADGVEQIELATPGEAAATALARVSIESPACEAHPEQFLLGVDDAATRKSVRRAVDLSDVALAGRPRALALATAELLRASWLELALPTAPEPLAPVPAPVQNAVRLRLAPAAVAPRPPEVPARWSPGVEGALETRVFPLTATGLGGFRLAVFVLSPTLGEGLRLRLRADGGASFGGASTALGDADVMVATGGLALTVVRGSPLGFELGARVDVGAARGAGRLVAGRSPAGTSVGEGVGALAILGATGAVRARFAAGVAGSLEVDLGGVLGGLDLRAVDPLMGTDTRLAGVLGMVLSVRLGLAWER